jgi:hypothetical protein
MSDTPTAATRASNCPRLYVGVTGTHGVGKTSFVTALEDTLLNNPVHGPFVLQPLHMTFAGPLRNNLVALTHTPLTDKRHPLERAALQYVGEMARAKDRNHWLRLFLERVQDATYREDDVAHQPDQLPVIVVLVDDVYHWNEAGAMDLLLQVRPENLDTLPRGPDASVSENETWELLDSLTPPAGETYMFYAERPAEFNTPKNQDRALGLILKALKERHVP